MDKIIKALSEIQTNGQITNLKEGLDIFNLFPSKFMNEIFHVIFCLLLI